MQMLQKKRRVFFFVSCQLWKLERKLLLGDFRKPWYVCQFCRIMFVLSLLGPTWFCCHSRYLLKGTLPHLHLMSVMFLQIKLSSLQHRVRDVEVESNKTRALFCLANGDLWLKMQHAKLSSATRILIIACCWLGPRLSRVGVRMKAKETMLCTFLGWVIHALCSDFVGSAWVNKSFCKATIHTYMILCWSLHQGFRWYIHTWSSAEASIEASANIWGFNPFRSTNFRQTCYEKYPPSPPILHSCCTPTLLTTLKTCCRE